MQLGDVAFQIDLAAAALAVVALLFSFWSGRRQRRIERETLRLQRDPDVIAWSNACLRAAGKVADSRMTDVPSAASQVSIRSMTVVIYTS